MKKLVSLCFVVLFASSVFAYTAHIDDVFWNGGTGLWMPTGNWTETSGTSVSGIDYWYVPGWVSGNPSNPGSWAYNSNNGRAIIQSGTAQITSGSKPDGQIERIYLGSAAGAALSISDDARAYRVYVGDDAGTTGTITQTAGNVIFGRADTYLGNAGSGTYNLQGGSLALATGGYTYIANAAGSSFMFNQTGGSVTTYRIKMGVADNAVGNYIISGGSLDITGYLSVYNDSTFKVSGSGATSISMLSLGMSRVAGSGQTLAIELDAGGSTMIRACGVKANGDAYEGAGLGNAMLTVDTLAGFTGTIGSTYDILWSATTIDTTDMSLVNLGSTLFDYAVVSDGETGQYLQLTVIPEPTTILILGLGGLLAVRRKQI